MDATKKIKRKPDWLRIKLPETGSYAKIRKYFKEHNIHTICESGHCPNFGECWDSGNATFMILGDICTRSCDFCNVKTGKPSPPDPTEPTTIANAAKFMNLKHCVLTSVDRDDLEDFGANHWSKTIKAIREAVPGITMETLIPDFKGKEECIDKIIELKPGIVSHNLETVERLTRKVRKQNIYQRSLDVLKYLAANGIRTKSGIMLGLGETREEILQTMDDLLQAQCKIMTLGQYLQPSRQHLEVEEYITPETFNEYKKIGLDKGFEFVESAPLVRSSYHAHLQV